MKKWKRYGSLLLALLMCLSMTACGDGKKDGSGDVIPAAPDVLEDLDPDDSAEYDYSAYLGTWEDGQGNVLTVEKRDDGQVYYQLLDVNGDSNARGTLQYVKAYDSVYVHNEFDGAAYLLRFDADELVFEYFGTYTKVSGDVPGDTIGDENSVEVEDPVVVIDDEVPDISGFIGFWKMDDSPLYYVINDICEWSSVDVYDNQVGPGYIVAEGDFITLFMEDGSEVITLWKNSAEELVDENGNTLSAVSSILLLPTPEDELSETAYFSGGFTNVSINYPYQMNAKPHANVSNSVSLTAVMEDGTDDYYTNIILAFQPISGYDSYMEKGAAVARTYMEIMLEDFITSMYGKYYIKSTGTDFSDNGDYYSITGYMLLDGSIFPDSGLSQSVCGSMEVRYYGPTGYALVAITVAPENRFDNYFDICGNILETISYRTNWRTSR